jgi:M6 family metalloprotease-like protein
MFRHDGRGGAHDVAARQGLGFLYFVSLESFMMRRAILLSSFALLMTQPGWAVRHVIPGAYPNAFQDMIHHPSEAQVRAAGSVKAALTSGSTGTKNIAVIVVQFQPPPAGETTLISGSYLISSVANIQTHYAQQAAYYQEVSYGKITLNFSFFNSDDAALTGDSTLHPSGAYTLAHTMEYYGCGDENVGCGLGVLTPTPPGTPSPNGNYLIRDAIIAARNGGHTGLISTDNGGTFDAIVVVHAGNGNETTQGTNGDIWSIFYSQDAAIIGGQSPSDPQPQAVAAGFDEGDVVPDTESSGIISPLGVMCHEFGHSLGLPDLYNTSAIGGASVVGKWEIMDSGPYDGAGANPSHMCAWDKITLGWITPLMQTGTITLGYVETNASALKIPVQNGLPQEYFLAEYRSPNSGATYDRAIPGNGILIWHVDDAITSSRGIDATAPGTQNTVNTGSPHYGVSIVAADGTNVGLTGGDASNPFGNGQNFIDPQSANFSGQPSGINLLNISGIGTATATMFLENLQVSASQSIIKLTNYPNPAGKNYPHPSGPGHTTIQIQLTRPTSDLQFNIYTLSGDLVRKISQSDITHRNDDANYKFVYEFVWDLTNGNGQMVAPGVYLYLARADGQSKTAKAVIIR